MPERSDHGFDSKRMRPRDDPPPARQRSSTLALPSNGGWILDLKIEKCIGKGRTASVYSVQPLSYRLLSANTPLAAIPAINALPPLVLKVSKPGFDTVSEVVHEKRVYNELEILQGSVIPRCYGLFNGAVSRDRCLLDWDQDDLGGDSAEVTFSVLLMEELGMPRELEDFRNTFPPETWSEWKDLLNDLSRLHVRYQDMRRHNFLYAAPSPPGLPSMMCPFHQRVHEMRIIDFGFCTKKTWHWENERDKLHLMDLKELRARLQEGDDDPMIVV
ncbi:hypothetical protein CERSUDRAFT_81531 [Gelatoporia subvermispora B]|uniref:Protein kinase domain-containing protein n=1 Tax=Ceriporiopsis subvermispora (strain B) TaxID=914234 RepID=M2RIS1_CERS8|nr:hypothetical protein CERSUDRAFT_81531 [Gelatoporia subvermispora B]